MTPISMQSSVGDPQFFSKATDIGLQELGYMSRRGQLYGMISTYHHSWFLKTDGRGNLWISDAVGANVYGGAEHVSVTEVCPSDFLHPYLGMMLVLQHVLQQNDLMLGALRRIVVLRF